MLRLGRDWPCRSFMELEGGERERWVDGEMSGWREWGRGGICFLLILLVLPADLLIVLVYGIQSDNGLNQSELGV